MSSPTLSEGCVPCCCPLLLASWSTSSFRSSVHSFSRSSFSFQVRELSPLITTDRASPPIDYFRTDAQGLRLEATWEHPSDRELRKVAADLRQEHERSDRAERKRQKAERLRRREEELKATETRIREEFEEHQRRSRRRWGEGLGSLWWAKAEGFLQHRSADPPAILSSPSRRREGHNESKIWAAEKNHVRDRGDESKDEEEREEDLCRGSPSHGAKVRTPRQRKASTGRRIFKSVFVQSDGQTGGSGSPPPVFGRGRSANDAFTRDFISYSGQGLSASLRQLHIGKLVYKRRRKETPGMKKTKARDISQRSGRGRENEVWSAERLTVDEGKKEDEKEHMKYSSPQRSKRWRTQNQFEVAATSSPARVGEEVQV